MARIRSLKPEFWTDGNIVRLSFAARLFYQGCWNFALCDRGHLPDDPMELKLRILPADEVDPVELVEELLTLGRLVRESTPDGRRFLRIVKLPDHNKADPRWSPRCPYCAATATPPETQRGSQKLPETPVSFPEPQGDSPELSGDSPQEGKGREGKGREGKNTPAEPSRDVVPARPEIDRLCAHLADRIEANGSTRPRITSKWRDAARLMLDRDGRTEENIHTAIDWCQDSDFWRANVLSMTKLRTQYDTLRLQAQRDRTVVSIDRRQQATNDLFDRAMQRAEAREKSGL